MSRVSIFEHVVEFVERRTALLATKWCANSESDACDTQLWLAVGIAVVAVIVIVLSIRSHLSRRNRATAKTSEKIPIVVTIFIVAIAALAAIAAYVKNSAPVSEMESHIEKLDRTQNSPADILRGDKAPRP